MSPVSTSAFCRIRSLWYCEKKRVKVNGCLMRNENKRTLISERAEVGDAFVEVATLLLAQPWAGETENVAPSPSKVHLRPYVSEISSSPS